MYDRQDAGIRQNSLHCIISCTLICWLLTVHTVFYCKSLNNREIQLM